MTSTIATVTRRRDHRLWHDSGFASQEPEEGLALVRASLGLDAFGAAHSGDDGEDDDDDDHVEGIIL